MEMKTFMNKKVYAEVYAVIEKEDDFRKILPIQVINDIQKKASGQETISFSNQNSIYQQISREALSFCISLYLEYSTDGEKKAEFKKLLIQNEIDYKALLHKEKTENDDENMIKMVDKIVKKELKNVIEEDTIGYQYYFTTLKQEMLKEYGIQWQPPIEINERIMKD